MNPEPDSAADDEAPSEAPIPANPAASAPAVAGTAPVMSGDDADADAPDTVPDQLRDTPAEQPLAEPVPASSDEPNAVSAQDAATSEGALPAESAPLPAPDLSPAATGARLAELFPALFVGPDGKGTWKAIKLRIHADIQARAPGQFSKRTLGIFFSRYTTTTPYLKALAAAGAQRVDLDGQPAGEIAEEHRSAAAEEVVRRQALAAERRAAHRPPRREAAPAAEGDASADAAREADPDRRPGPRPELRSETRPAQRPERRPDNRPTARPAQRPQEGGPRSERVHQSGPDAPPSPHAARPARPPRHADRAPHAAPTQRTERTQPMQRPESPAALPVDPAQRERAVLLRSFEASPLSKANFCALKGMTEAALDAALAQANPERSQQGAAPNAMARRGGGR